MGGQTSSTPQIGASPMGSLPQTQPMAPMGGNPSLAGLFGGNIGYQQNQLPQIMAPQYPAALTPTPDQAAAATMARMKAIMPYAPATSNDNPFASLRRGSGAHSPSSGR